MISRTKLKELKQLVKEKGFTFEKDINPLVGYGKFIKREDKLWIIISVNIKESNNEPCSTFPFIFDESSLPMIVVTVWSGKGYVNELIQYLIECLNKINYNWNLH